MLIGVFLAICIRGVSLRKNSQSRLAQIHSLAFFVMVFYMVAQSYRGMVISESLRQVRWVVCYLMLGTVAFVIGQPSLSLPSGRKAKFLILYSLVVYFSFYTLVGLVYEQVLGIPRWFFQNIAWGGTMYAVFPMVIALPAVVSFLKDKQVRARRIAWIALILMILVSFYYDSRISWLCLLIFLVGCSWKLGFRYFARYAALFLVRLWFALTVLCPFY